MNHIRTTSTVILSILFVLMQSIPNAFAGSVTLSLLSVGQQGQTQMFRAAISSSTLPQIQAIRLEDAKGTGGSDGVFSGFDLDCVFLDMDGNLATTGDRVLPVLTSATVFQPGNIRNPATTSYVPTASKPGPLTGTNADGSINHSLATIGTRDGAFTNPLTVNSSTGSLTLGVGGVIYVSFPQTTVPPGGSVYLFVGETGGGGESIAATTEVFDSVSTLTINPAVELSFITETGRNYQIQSSDDLATWFNEGIPISGTGGVILRYFNTANKPKRFYRVEVN